MEYPEIHTCAEMTAFVDEIGFLPLLEMGVAGWSAEGVADDEAQYTRLPGGGWEWPLWEWKGEVVRESGCAYGKFFCGKAGYVSRAWWPDFCNWRRSRVRRTEEYSVDDMIVETLREGGSMLTRELRAACGFTGKMRGQFDTYIAHLAMDARVVTQDFVYPQDRHGRNYGWGWSLLTTPEALFGREACHPDRTPEESFERMRAHLYKVLPAPSDALVTRLLR